jgi:hypothetical protein
MTTTARIYLCLTLCCTLARPGDAQSAIGFFPIPTRAFVVGGGSIGLQSGVMRNRAVHPADSGLARYPTRYFLVARNETDSVIAVGVEWQFPGEDWKKGGQTALVPGQDMAFWQDKLGVFADTAINVRVSVFAATNPPTKIGTEETFLRFTSTERDGFLRVAFEQGQQTMMTGWPEMGHPADSVPGTQADAELQSDIQLFLWKEESKQHRDCKHEAVRATPAVLDSSSIIAGMLAAGDRPASAARNLVKQAHQGRDREVPHLEYWVMTSCGDVTTYEVLLAPARQGTDIIVRQAVRDSTAQKP